MPFIKVGAITRPGPTVMCMAFLADLSWPVAHLSAALVAPEVPDGTEVLGDQDRVYDLASVTKLLSAWAFLVAVEEGVFDLDQEVRPLVPTAPAGATVRHMLAHASGVGFDSRTPQREVGQRRIYSSAGFEILADAVEAEAGMPFGHYAAEAVFAPLGMDATEITGSAGHGGRSTVRDLVAFAGEVLNPRLLAEQTVQRALEVHFPELGGVVPGYGMHKPCPWGLGFEVHGSKNPHWLGTAFPADTVGHFGQAGTFLWVHRPTRRAMVVLSDRAFGEWAKPLWQEDTARVWALLEGKARA